MMRWFLSFPDASLAYQIYAAITYLAVLVLVYLNLRYVLPPLARETYAWCVEAFTAERPANVVDLAERRRQLAAAAHPDRRVS